MSPQHRLTELASSLDFRFFALETLLASYLSTGVSLIIAYELNLVFHYTKPFPWHFPSGSAHGRMPPSSSLDGMPAGSSFTKVCPAGYSSALGENIISDLRRQRYEESARETERRVM